MRLDRRVSVLVSFLVLVTGCASSQRYTPRQDLVKSMGAAQAAGSLQSLWLKAEAPKLSDVQFSADAIEFSCQSGSYILEGFHASFAEQQFLHCPAERVKVVFTEIDRIVIFRPDHVVSLYRANGTAILKLKLAGQPEAHSFADLLASFRAALQREAGSPVRPLAVGYDRRDGRLFTSSPAMN